MPNTSNDDKHHSASPASSSLDDKHDFASFASQVGSNATLQMNMKKTRTTVRIMMMSTMMMIMMGDTEHDDEHDVAPSRRRHLYVSSVPWVDPEMEGGYHHRIPSATSSREENHD